MSTSATPYGLVPVKNADGSAYNGARDAFLISPTGLAERIGYGSVVFLSAGYVKLSLDQGAANDATNFGGATNVGALGVFVGCEYINTEGQLIFSQFYPENTLNATAYVVTDPGVTFMAQSVGTQAQAVLGHNCHLSADAGATSSVSNTTGKSNLSVTAAETTDCAFKIVGFSDRPGSSVGDSYTDVLIKFNPNYHAMLSATVGV